MGHYRSRVLVGVVLATCVGIVGSVAHGSGKSPLGLSLSADDAGPGHLPPTFRVVISNLSDHEVMVGNLCLTFYAGEDFYAWAWAAGPKEFELGAGKSVVQVLPGSSLELRGPEGQLRLATAVAARLSRSRWSVLASVQDYSVGGSTGCAVAAWSNELEFGPAPVRQARR